MNEYSYNYKCYKLGQLIYGYLKLNSSTDDNALNEAKDFLYKNVSNRFCFINLENKTKTDEKSQNTLNTIIFKLSVPYSPK
jgi:hypothetical protein